MIINRPKPAYWLIGPPGSGKSNWIYERAKKTGARILRIHARVDRSFRDGRPLLFAMHRASEPTIVWIEGADVLTPEAQAFLRRIIETCSKHVEFILETRDETRISVPIRSRCVTVYFTDKSHRQDEYKEQLSNLPARIINVIKNTHLQEEKWIEDASKDHVKAIIKARTQSLNPCVLLEKVLHRLDVSRQDIYKRAWGSGRSVWGILALASCEAFSSASK